MLTGLVIKNFALIDYLEVDFSEGMTSITGETGAGKSILLGGLGLVLGKRADLSTLKDNTKKCYVEATFSIQEYKLKNLFESLDLEYDPITLIRREISLSGKSRAFINDSPVNLDTLQRLGEKLIDIHSQHQTLSLVQSNYQLELLDSLAKNEEPLNQYKQKLKEYKSVEKQLADLTELQNTQNQDLDYSTFLLEELLAVDLAPTMLVSLEGEEKKLNHAEDIKQNLIRANQIIRDEQIGIEVQLNEVRLALLKTSSLSESFTPLLNRLESLKIELEDINQEIEQQSEQIEINPERLDIIRNTLQKIYDLQAKHNCQSIDELIIVRDELTQKVNSTESLKENLTALTQQKNQYQEELLNIALELSKKRKSVSPILKKELEALLKNLGMPNARFNIDVLPSEDFLAHGKDHVVFEFSANQGYDFSSLQKVASGGELSRIMLSIKATLSRFKTLPTIIFDEIDTGVSGEVSYKIGEVMQQMSTYMQVITISHLPQVAAKGKNHFKVFKQTKNQSTFTQLKKLNSEERITEIAQMLSGKEIYETAIQHAKELLN